MKNNIASERVRVGLTQGQLAQKIGVTLSTVSRWENGDNPRADNICDMAKLFGCTSDYLLGMSEERR